MKILIVSDTHGNCYYLDEVLELHQDIDLLIHLGDVCGDCDYIEAVAPCKTLMVAGNNDYFLRIDNEKLVDVDGYQVFITHGHYYGVYYGMERLLQRGKELGADVVMCGHTHIPVIECSDNIYCINPGSLSLPRQEGKRKSYIIMSTENEELDFQLLFID